MLRCHGDHKLFAPIRPIALTICDAVTLARRNKFLAAALGGIIVLLLVCAHFAASNIKSQTVDIIYSMIRSYLSQKATGVVYQSVLYWATCYGVFYVFRLCAYCVLYAAYDLGRDAVFAISLLIGFTVFGILAFAHFTSGRTVWGAETSAWSMVFAGYIGWFSSRYMTGRNDQHRSFDADVGIALARFRPR